MGTLPRPANTRGTMRPPARPPHTNNASMTGRAASPAESTVSVNTSTVGNKRKERDYEQDGGEETNIHVVVRCRGRSDREVKENSGVVVSTNGAKGKTVELSMGPNALSNKTYHFDKVFSPAADQAIIFDDVVAPILNEMLAGYNCTIFAYGQTGTGKTYTMSGDMTDTLGLLSDAAGIIPRVLYALFQKLETDEIECSVKCSFIELYNEELRDLLTRDENVKLKIFEDSNKKNHTATLVQGMEESHIKNASAGIKLLQEGSHRRQVAATKCNDLSSRSHTVFTITTYIKKANDSGDDFICAGKLNLVDLAGSENIQRSGAENKRAAEAGLINKSLLTLGRVINALVDKSSHIPYRESKLTRLLQDSLGGRTKTCIIATVSPAKSNLEETISTLDYAFRAKNIRNKPQVNSMISKKTLLKEFTMEIEKLKGELIATRQRNGVYLTNEQFEEITLESESRRILSEEQKARIETMETSLRNKVQELFSLTNNFMNLKKDNEATRVALEGTKDVLTQTELVLRDTRQSLAEETVIREAHQKTEEELLGIGAELVSTVGASVKDLDGVHAKLRRRSALHNQNRGIWQTSAGRIDSIAQQVDSCLEEFQEMHSGLLTTSSRRIASFLTAETTKLEESAELLLAKTIDLERTQTEVEHQSSNARDDMNNVLEEIKVLREDVKEKVAEGLQGLSHAASKISGEVISELEDFHTQLHTSYSSLGKEFKAMFEDITKQLAAQKDEADCLRKALQEANRKANETTLLASVQLEDYMKSEREVARQERQLLKDQIFALIDGDAAKQDERTSKALNQTRAHLEDSNKAFERADQTYNNGMDDWTNRYQRITEQITKSKDDLKNRMKKDWTAVSSRNTAIQTSTKAVHEETVKIVDVQLKEMATQMAALDEFVTRARNQNDTHHNEHIASLKIVSNHVDETFDTLKQNLNDHKSALQGFDVDSQVEVEAFKMAVSSLKTNTRQPLQTLRAEISSSGLAEYIPTGETPQKKEWVYPTDLPKTESRDSMIAKLRGLPDPAATAKTPSASRTPARSPRKQTSPRKLTSPTKTSSPTKGKIYTDTVENAQPIASNVSQSVIGMEAPKGLKEIDINVVPRPVSASDDQPSINFSKSVGGGPPPLKKHASASAVESKLPMKMGRGKGVVTPGVENFSQSLGIGRRLRSSPPG